MAKGIRKVQFFVLHANDKPGEAAHLLKTLNKYKINLLAMSAFSSSRGSQIELIPENAEQLRELARKYGWKLSSKKTGFLAQGKDRAGALAKLAEKLGKAGINITAVDAIAAGLDRYGAVFWVRPKDVEHASEVLGAR
ncbi:MAG: hypothetical protein PHP86_12015 [Nevskiales bacterium]|nr:hypothetical protein [Nevskiales bacterium]